MILDTNMSKHPTRRMLVGSILLGSASAIVQPRQTLAASAPLPGVTDIDRDLTYPEGMLLHRDHLYVVDILRGQMIVYNAPGFARDHVASIPSCGPTSIAPFLADRLLVTCYMSGGLQLLSENGDLKDRIETTSDNRPILWPNDSCPDGAGGAFVTSSGLFDLKAPSVGAVVHVTAKSEARVIVQGLHYANGIAYDPKTRELFVTEHFENRVHVYRLDELFFVRDGRIFFDLHGLPKPNVPAYDRMGPDNLRLRSNGDLIIPQYGGGRFIIVSRAGELKHLVDVPCQFITDTEDYQGDVLFIGGYDVNSKDPKGVLGRVHLA